MTERKTIRTYLTFICSKESIRSYGLNLLYEPSFLVPVVAISVDVAISANVTLSADVALSVDFAIFVMSLFQLMLLFQLMSPFS